MSTIANDASLQSRHSALSRRRAAESARPESTERRPLSPGQRRAWFLQTRDPDDTGLNIVASYRLRGPVVPARLRGAVRTVAGRHEMLRTTYDLGGDGEPYQTTDAETLPAWHEHDLAELSPTSAGRRREVLARREIRRPFELTDESPLRVMLFRDGTDEFVLVLIAHTIAWDDESLAVFTTELTAAYNGSALRPRSNVQLTDLVTEHDSDADLAYWRRALAALPEPLDLPGRPDKAAGDEVSSEQRSRHTVELGFALVQRIAAFAEQIESESRTVLLAGYAALLHRYTAAADFLIAMPVSTRPLGAEALIGYSENTVLVRAAPHPEDPFEMFASAVHTTLAEAFEHRNAGIDQVIRAVNPVRSRERDGMQQLVRLGFAVRGELPGLELDEVTATVREAGSAALSVPLRFTVLLDSDSPRVEAEYRSDLFDTYVVEQMLADYLQLLDSALTDSRQPIAAVDLFGTANRERLLAASHGELVDSTPTTLVDLVRARAAATPEALAVVAPAGSEDTDVELSYAALMRRVNRLAHWLVAQGVGTEDLVGLRIANSVEFLVAILATLEAGAGYLPIDPAYPDERIEFLTADAVPTVVLDSAQLQAAEETAAELSEHGLTDADRLRPLRPENLAYVIYTSGSTGTPKGVPVPHAAIADHIQGFCAEWEMTDRDRLLQSSSVSFDASLLDIFVTLNLGACLVVPKSDAFRDIPYVADLIARYGVTVLHMVPSVLSTFLLLPEVAEWRALRHVPVGGEALLGEVADRFAGVFDAELRNHYGPTEAVVSVTHMTVCGPQGTRVVPVGTPNRNVYAYVLDNRMQLVPDGVVGEIYLGGTQLARGYLGRSALTAQRFVADPFLPGKRLYRTGDQARRNANGDLEFVGRADEQVKIRGYRVELGEVQAALSSHPDVGSCAIVAAPDPAIGTALAAYLVPAGETNIDIGAVRAHAATSLPEYMLPTSYAVLDEIPLTMHGKLDKRALPEPQRVRGPERREPGTVTEVGLADLFGEIFGRDGIGADDSFFELGGHSLLANRLVLAIRAEFGVEVGVRAPFDNPTVAGLSAVIDATPVTADHLALPVLGGQPRPERIPLSHNQLAVVESDADSVVQLAVRFDGPLSEQTLTAALDDVVAQHAPLRMGFDLQNAVPYQFVAAGADADIAVHAIDDAELPRALDEAGRADFTPAAGAVFAARIFALASGAQVLSLVAHGLVADQWSLRIVLADLADAYRSRTDSGEAPNWVAPIVDLADYALWQRAVEATGASSAGARSSGWEELPEPADIATDLADAGEPGTARTAAFRIPAALRRQLRALAEAAGASEFMLYQAMVAALLHKLGAGADIAIGAPFADRTETTGELVGPLASTVVLRHDLCGEPTLRTVLDRARSTALGAYADSEASVACGTRAGRPHRLQAAVEVREQDWPAQSSFGDDIAVTPLPLRHETDRELGFTFVAAADGSFDGTVTADGNRYEPATVERIAEYVARVATAFAEGPDQTVSEVNLLTAAERCRVVDEWSTGVDPGGIPGLAMVFRYARAVPGTRLAVRYGNESVTYGELFGPSWQRAAAEVSGSRTAAEVAGLFTMLDQILRDGTGSVGPLVLDANAIAVAVSDRRCLAADRKPCPVDPARSRADMRLVALPQDDAQIAADLLAAAADGACLVFATETQRHNPAALAQLITENSVTHVTAPPETLTGLTDTGVAMPSVLRWDVTGIEWPAQLPGRLRELAPDSVATFGYRVPAYLGAVARGQFTETGRARPVPGAKLFVLDAYRRPVAPGVVGEVYVGGAALSAGFTDGNDDRRFVADPSSPGEQLYRTGEHARWTTDGRLILI